MATPLRRPGSVRRTTSIDMWWPNGRDGQLRLLGRARDLWTPADGRSPHILAESSVLVDAAPDRTILRIDTDPPRPGVDELVGARGGGRLRRRLAEALPDEVAAGTPLALLLDDLAGSTLIAGFAWRQWTPGSTTSETDRPAARRRMTGVCAGFRPGSSALDDEGRARDIHDIRPVAPLPNPTDPLGWHQLTEPDGVAMRRARRIDVWVVPGESTLRVDSMFQDSSTTPDGGRVAVHEYRIEATVDSEGRLATVTADPRVLPYRECPWAADNVDRVVGAAVSDLRTVVLERLKGTVGCTHLNDALRALAEVEVLAAPLRAKSIHQEAP